MKFNKDKIFNIIVIFLFVVLSLIIGHFHEPWVDEAHAWLFARDSSVFSLITKYVHSDGHPILWHLILKVFIFFKLPYSKIHLVSILFSSIGVSLFVCKSKFNKLIKVLFTFSYFIFYQYNIVARGYCLLLPILCLIAIMWNERHNKIYLFTILLILLLSTEVYTFLLAGCIYLYLLIEFYKNKYDNKKSHIICFIILFLMFLFTTIYCFPLKTNAFRPENIFDFYYLSYSFFYPFVKHNENLIIDFGSFISSFMLILYFYKIYSNDKKKLIQFGLFVGLPVLFLIFKYFTGWHFGIVTLICIFCFWIHEKHDNKLVVKLLVFSFVCQIPWTIYTVYNDIKYPYYATEEAAEFIKTYDYSNMKIFGNGFYPSGINPYFEKNLYYNYSDDVGFFYWDLKGSYFDDIYEYKADILSKYYDNDYSKMDVGLLMLTPYEYSVDYYLDRDVKMIVTNNYGKDIRILYLNSYDDILEYYNEYKFEGKFVFEMGVYEKIDMFVYVRKDVDWRSNNE